MKIKLKHVIGTLILLTTNTVLSEDFYVSENITIKKYKEPYSYNNKCDLIIHKKDKLIDVQIIFTDDKAYGSIGKNIPIIGMRYKIDNNNYYTYGVTSNNAIPRTYIMKPFEYSQFIRELSYGTTLKYQLISVNTFFSPDEVKVNISDFKNALKTFKSCK